MEVFPLKLGDISNEWFKILGLRFESWSEIKKDFLKKFYCVEKTNIYRFFIEIFLKVLILFIKHGKD